MDIGKELRVIEVDDPADAPLEVERVPAEELGEKPADTGVTNG